MEFASPALEELLPDLSEFTSPALEELLPDLSPEEQLRWQNQFRERERIWKRHNKKQKQQHSSPPLPTPCYSEGERDLFMIPQVHHALRHYNARHPGAEFDAVKPLMQCHVGFRGQVWFHLNFWARSRSSTNKKMIKRFFAEVHYKPPPASSFANSPLPTPIPMVEVCTIIEEPLSQYKHSCAFCPGHLDILHPNGRKFVCGNDKDRTGQQFLNCNTGIGLVAGMPFTGRTRK